MHTSADDSAQPVLDKLQERNAELENVTTRWLELDELNQAYVASRRTTG